MTLSWPCPRRLTWESEPGASRAARRRPPVPRRPSRTTTAPASMQGSGHVVDAAEVEVGTVCT
jgi:hypothetical protein